jgi:hypothetical protein
MILLDNHLTDLVRGYDRISQADLRLQTGWRQHLLQKYASRRDKHTSAFGAYIEKIGVLNPQLTILAFIPLAMLIGGLVITIVGAVLNVYAGAELTWSIGGVSLIIAGALGIGLPTLLWLWQVKLAKPAAPTHPLREDLLARLTPQWREKLHGALPVATLDHRDAGARIFVEHLQSLSADSMYILCGLRQTRDEEIDAMVLGARGIWVFAIGRDATRAEQLNQQWQRMADAVAQTLAARAPDLVKRFPTLEPIKGGVVLTDSKVWDQEITSAPIIPGLDDRAIFGLIDALLEQHHASGGDAATISMSAHATKMIRQAEARLREWMK